MKHDSVSSSQKVRKAQTGFTLIELLVVITIIGILATLIVANFSSSRARARDVKRKSDLNQIKTALRLYYNDNQSYPTTAGCCDWGEEFVVSGETYMRQIPTDPLNTGLFVYQYEQTNSGDGFELTARLENPSDEDSLASQTRCGVSDPESLVYMVCED